MALAYESDELELSEEEKAMARHLASVPGTETPSPGELIDCLRRFGRDQAILEVALALPLEAYRRVEEVYREVDPPSQPKIRRRK